MRKKCIVFLFISITVAVGCRRDSLRSSGENVSDSIFTADYINGLSITQPERALALLDTAEQRGLLSPIDRNGLRAVIYNNGLEQPNVALTYSFRIYHDPEIRNAPEKLLKCLKIISHQYYKNGDYTQSVRYALEGIEVSRKTGSKRDEALFQLHVGLSKAAAGISEDAYPFFDRSIGLYRQEMGGSPAWSEVDEFLYALMEKVNALQNDKMYRDAIDMLPLCEKTLQHLNTCPGLPEGIYDLRCANLYTLYALIFYLNGDKMKAENYYDKLLRTQYVHTLGGNALTAPYQIVSHRYEDALRSLQKEKEYFRTGRDTVNAYYVETLLPNEMKAYDGLGDYRSAARVAHSIVALTDSLRMREKRKSAIELATIYETKEKEALLQEQSAQLKRRNIVLASVLLILALSAGFIFKMIRFNRTISRKNKAAVKTIHELLGFRDRLFRVNEENMALQQRLQEAMKPGGYLPLTDTYPVVSGKDVSPADNAANGNGFSSCDYDRMLFDKVEHEIISGQLFLQPRFSRDDLTKTIYIPKNKFAQLFKQYAGKNFISYINDLRLEYAARILKEYPVYTIDAVAKQCGMSPQSFYRLFSGKFGVTPMEYQSAASQITDVPCPDDTDD
ncbi:helix-turn-helix domain-containing protein [Limibacterium fermenti]|uniref:helix-turn-helix domain-containing protein n=1 Tax=Limibacterium fermenti TaxID=3229863 RepID=UPI000E826DCA|nr:hypothetical protein [Porphyromonadaceae bacterium]